MAAGMDGYLSKPIRPQELDAVLDNYVAQHQAADAVERHSLALSNDVVNTEELLERIDSDRVFLAELVELFRSDYPVQLQAAREALAQKDATGVKHVGHTLKGALSNLSATGALNMAREIESLGKSGNLSPVEGLLAQLEQELGRVTLKLESLCLEMAR